MNSREWIGLVEQVGAVAEALEAAPELRPLVERMLGLNGTAAPVATRAPMRRAPTGRKVSEAQRRKMSLMAKRRWAKAKRAGKNTIGGAD